MAVRGAARTSRSAPVQLESRVIVPLLENACPSSEYFAMCCACTPSNLQNPPLPASRNKLANQPKTPTTLSLSGLAFPLSHAPLQQISSPSSRPSKAFQRDFTVPGADRPTPLLGPRTDEWRVKFCSREEQGRGRTRLGQAKEANGGQRLGFFHASCRAMVINSR